MTPVNKKSVNTLKKWVTRLNRNSRKRIGRGVKKVERTKEKVLAGSTNSPTSENTIRHCHPIRRACK